MTTSLSSLLLLSIFIVFVSGCSAAESTATVKPHAIDSFNLSLIQNVGSCSYTVVISTSCSSPVYTRDQISIAFGDAYGNQISGPCAYQICYVYLYRSGPDGWKPGSVKIYGYNSRAATFNYNTYIPGDLWYGFNFCGNAASGSSRRIPGWFVCVILWLFGSAVL
ncbi:unnamed protein product [Linum tenue]|uniref:Uncharacterized protein n=1 Tax=Linum tenue TaxID=586396 RepID=A0AAV0J3V0_9ROSI|nr:unnamed protein product [Linum tenue]